MTLLQVHTRWFVLVHTLYIIMILDCVNKRVSGHIEAVRLPLRLPPIGKEVSVSQSVSQSVLCLLS